MKIDIFDTTVPDYSILDKKSLMESLGYESETSLRNAVDSGFIHRRWTTADAMAQAAGLSA